ncbi:hypothetical protein ARMGADRAFT_1091125 [Armillaria gallica]|uniref:Uncharacterized protein n=1 Tax=Armillaria gallica TaxID=47427 RepID=A0A2H3CEW0_ARMGA|nr:hypothetical protein ARMGADRAFT_1091125 [Armillaria gallica]
MHPRLTHLPFFEWGIMILWLLFSLKPMVVVRLLTIPTPTFSTPYHLLQGHWCSNDLSTTIMDYGQSHDKLKYTIRPRNDSRTVVDPIPPLFQPPTSRVPHSSTPQPHA